MHDYSGCGIPGGSVDFVPFIFYTERSHRELTLSDDVHTANGFIYYPDAFGYLDAFLICHRDGFEDIVIDDAGGMLIGFRAGLTFVDLFDHLSGTTRVRDR